MRIDHVAIAVNDLEAAAARYRDVLGADKVEFETVETEGVRVAIIRLENGRVELLQPMDEKSPIKKFIEKRGEGIHHMALETNDMTDEVSRLKGLGVRFLGEPRPGSENTTVTFVHPRSLHGVLTELCFYDRTS